MTKRSLSVLAAMLLLAVGALPASGQEKLVEGVWTGTVFPPDDELVAVEYEVSYGEAGLEINLVPPVELGMGAIPAESPTFLEDTLTFMLNVGESVGCSLFMHEDGHFEGECVDSSGGAAILTMYPPEARVVRRIRPVSRPPTMPSIEISSPGSSSPLACGRASRALTPVPVGLRSTSPSANTHT